MKVNDRTVVITDAQSDSGKAIANKFRDIGCRLILFSSSNDVPQSSMQSEMWLIADPSDPIQVNRQMKKAYESFGTIDVLIHNNSLLFKKSIEDISESEFLTSFDINAKSAFIFTRAAAEYMICQSSGRIVFVSSIHDEKPTGCDFAFSVSKGAVKMLAKEAALDLGSYGIRVNLIEMGPVEGDDQVFSSNISYIYEDYVSKIPNHSIGSYYDLANLVKFLAIDCNNYLNGAHIRLDGGFVMHYIDRI